MYRCPFCKKENRDSAKYCRHCGRSIMNRYYCPMCGGENRREAKYCRNCGRSFSIMCPTGHIIEKKDLGINVCRIHRQATVYAARQHWAILFYN